MFQFRIDGDLRFISHHDTLRLFQRALVRARVPVRWSKGFNPQPRVQIPLPRPVGVASQDDAVIVETEELIEPGGAMDELQRHLPADLNILGVRRLAVGEKPRPASVRYRLDLAGAVLVNLNKRIEDILGKTSIIVERKNAKTRAIHTVDIRSYISAIEARDAAVEFTLRVTDHGTSRATEIAALLGLGEDGIIHRIRRMEIQWK